jgi:predicted O-methyltransferase YrrM
LAHLNGDRPFHQDLLWTSTDAATAQQHHHHDRYDCSYSQHVAFSHFLTVQSLPLIYAKTMTNKSLNMGDRLYDYLLSVSLREPEILLKLREETARHPMSQMQIAPEQGQFMALLVQLMGAAKTLEVGVFTGYSALTVALALPENGQVVACDVSEEFTAIARRYWEMAGVANKIDLRIAPATETLDQLLAEGQAETFDFAFIDADKSNYGTYYEQALQLVRPGGMILIDNVLWSGRVADGQVQDTRTEAIRAFNRKLHEDQRVTLSMVAIADGLTLALKRP